jgi:putative polyketide hydroxylase
MTTIQTQVAIIGGSLVGLSTAMFLAARGVKCILIERHRGSSPHPRAIGYTHRTIETFRTVGLDKDIPPLPPGVGGKPRRVKTKAMNAEWEEETHWASGKGKGGGRGPPPDLSDVTPVRDTAIAQDKLEPLIRAKAVALGADMRLGYKATSWSQDDTGVTVIIAPAAVATAPANESITVKASYLIAADGASSAVRESLNISTEGVGHLRTLRSILFTSPTLTERYSSKGIAQWSIANDEIEAFMVAYPDGRVSQPENRWALMTSIPSSRDDTSNNNSTTDDEQQWTDDHQREMITKAAGEVLQDVHLITSGQWALRASIATSFSQGRIFLVGDAAHALPPNRGGYGANTGFGDAFNISWKLASVLSGAARDGLLDTYGAERRKVAVERHDQIFARDDYGEYVAGTRWEGATVLDDVAMELGQVYDVGAVCFSAGDEKMLREGEVARRPGQWKGMPGTRAPHVWLLKGGQDMSTLDLFGKGWVVVSCNERWGDVVAENIKIEVEFVQVGKDVEEKAEGSFGDMFGVGGRGASLVRPDGIVAARWTGEVAGAEFGMVLDRVAYL